MKYTIYEVDNYEYPNGGSSKIIEAESFQEALYDSLEDPSESFDGNSKEEILKEIEGCFEREGEGVWYAGEIDCNMTVITEGDKSDAMGCLATNCFE